MVHAGKDLVLTTVLITRRGMATYMGRDTSKLKGKGGKWKYMSEQEMLDIASRFSPYRYVRLRSSPRPSPPRAVAPFADVRCTSLHPHRLTQVDRCSCGICGESRTLISACCRARNGAHMDVGGACQVGIGGLQCVACACERRVRFPGDGDVAWVDGDECHTCLVSTAPVMSCCVRLGMGLAASLMLIGVVAAGRGVDAGQVIFAAAYYIERWKVMPCYSRAFVLVCI